MLYIARLSTVYSCFRRFFCQRSHAVLDAFVLDAWGHSQNAHGKVVFLGELIDYN